MVLRTPNVPAEARARAARSYAARQVRGATESGEMGPPPWRRAAVAFVFFVLATASMTALVSLAVYYDPRLTFL